MMHGCTEPSSILHPYAFAIAAHNRTDPMGVNANATMTKNTSEYHSHGNFLLACCSSPRFQIIGWESIALVASSRSLLNNPVLPGPVPKRCEPGRRRFVRSLKMRLVVL